MPESTIISDPEILAGTPCFRGTRVPLQNLVDYLEGGDSIDQFLEQFPSVSREQVTRAIEEMKIALLKSVDRAA